MGGCLKIGQRIAPKRKADRWRSATTVADTDEHLAMQFLKIADVEEKVGLKKSEIYRRISIGDFPPPLRLGRRAVVWVDQQVEAWMARKVEEAEAEALSPGNRKPSRPAGPPRGLRRRASSE